MSSIPKRTLIADAIVKRLKGKTLAKNNVAYSYTPKPNMNQMPVILIYAVSESFEELSQAPRELRRLLFMNIEIIADGSDDVDMAIRLDETADLVEQLITQDDTLDCTVDDIMLNNIEFQYEGDEYESPVGSCRMTWLAKYREFMPREVQNVDDFNSAKIDWDIHPQGDPDGDPEATDIVKFE